MHTRILITGDNPMTLMADSTLLKDSGMYVYTATNLDNIQELIAEIKPDVIFFHSVNMDENVNTAYNQVLNNTGFKDIAIVYTLTEDEVYLVTPKRIRSAAKKSHRAESVIDAIKMALKITPDLQKQYLPKRPRLQPQQLQLTLHAA